MHKLIIPFLALALVLTGCADIPEPPAPSLTESSSASASGFPANATIGVAMPHRTSECCPVTGRFETGLSEAGFTPMLRYGDGGEHDQMSQIQEMIEAGAKVIIIAAIGPDSLVTQLADAKAAGITVIAYDRLLMDSPNVDMYIAHDFCEVGRQQAGSLLEGLAKTGVGPYNIELIAGSHDDRYAPVFFDCAMEVLQPKIDDGTLRVPSGQVAFEQVSTLGWLPSQLKERFGTLLPSVYKKGTQLDGVLSPNDTLARAAITTIADAHIPIPVITGQDSELESVRWITEGKQYSTIFRDNIALIDETINLVKQLQQGKEITFTDTTSYHNGKKIVPAVILPSVIVTQENVCTVYPPYADASAVTANAPFCQGE